MFKCLTLGRARKKTRLVVQDKYIFLRGSSFISLLAPWAKTQTSRSPAKFLITILRRKGKFSGQG